MLEFWIARDKNNELFLYKEEPVRGEELFTPRDFPSSNNKVETFYSIDSFLFPEVTWDNSPLKVEINIKF